MTELLERRRLLAACAATFAAPAGAAPAGVIRVTPEGGAPILYQLAGARDAGSFQGPGFVQHCFVLPRAAALPALGVIYRPDADGRRHEVVLELTDAAGRQAAEMGGYAVTLELGSRVVLGGSTPKHYWAGRWRLQTAPRPRVRTVESLIRAGLVPAFEATGATGQPGRPYTPMGMADVSPAFGMTGGRPEIGLFPAWTTEFLATGSDVAWQRVVANAEACATVPWHWRDETGQIFNIDRHPDWAIDGRFAPADKTPTLPTTRDPLRANPEDAHQPQLSYVAYLITGDPYFLEELQCQANWHMWSHGSTNGLGLLFPGAQVRGLAWTLRQVALAAVATPDPVPSWLLPREYFQRKLENNRRWFAEQTVDSIDPVAQTFHFPWIVDLKNVAGWQEDFISLVLAQIVRMGFTAWRPIYDWACGNLIARGNGTSGWPRQFPCWYYITLRKPDGELVADWASLAELNQDKLKPTPPNWDYFGIYLAALRSAVSLGNRDALPILDFYVRNSRAEQKYLISPQPAPPVPPQPANRGDPQYSPGLQRLPPQPGRYPWLNQSGRGTWQVLGTAAGQTLTIGLPANIWSIQRYNARVSSFYNLKSYNQVMVKNIQHVAFADKTYDLAAGEWLPEKPR
jgi:hypothetical protein